MNSNPRNFTPADDIDFDKPGTIAYYATLLEDPSTEVTMESWMREQEGFLWKLHVSTPENANAAYAWGSWTW